MPNWPPHAKNQALATTGPARILRRATIAEFDAGDPEATLHALADEILKYRRAVRLLATAIGWADAGAPFGLMGPDPLWRPRRTNKDDVVPPVASVRTP